MPSLNHKIKDELPLYIGSLTTV